MEADNVADVRMWAFCIGFRNLLAGIGAIVGLVILWKDGEEGAEPRLLNLPAQLRNATHASFSHCGTIAGSLCAATTSRIPRSPLGRCCTG